MLNNINSNTTTTKNKSGRYIYHYDRLTIQDHLNVLSNDYERKSNGSYLCRCPLKHNHPHEDETKSLVISEGRDQSVVYYCLSHGGNGNNMHFNDGECTQKKLSAKFHQLLRDNGTLDKVCKVYHYGKDEPYPKIKLNAVYLGGERQLPHRDKIVKIPKSWKFKTEFVSDEDKIKKLQAISGKINQKVLDDNAALLMELGVIKSMLVNGWPRKLVVSMISAACSNQVHRYNEKGGIDDLQSKLS